MYTQNSSGQSVIGNLSNLLDAIRDGHRVRVQISALDAITAEADAIRDDHADALLLHVVIDHGTKTPTNISMASEGQTHRAWFMVSTTGGILIRRINMASTPSTQHINTVIDCEVNWFINTRPWGRVCATNTSTSQPPLTPSTRPS